MAYEPGGGTGEPYDKSEDLMYTPGGSVQDYIRNMMLQGNVGMAQPMGNNIRDFAQDRMMGREQPSDLDMPGQRPSGMGPYDDNTRMDPQQLIQMLLAARGR